MVTQYCSTAEACSACITTSGCHSLLCVNLYVHSKVRHTTQPVLWAKWATNLWLLPHFKQPFNCMCSHRTGCALLKAKGPHLQHANFPVSGNNTPSSPTLDLGCRKILSFLLTMPVSNEGMMDMESCCGADGGQVRWWTQHSPLPSLSNLARER